MITQSHVKVCPGNAYMHMDFQESAANGTALSTLQRRPLIPRAVNSASDVRMHFHPFTRSHTYSGTN